MKILFDQNVPLNLAVHLPKHEVSTAGSMGWEELENGDLLKAAEAGGFSLFVTCDQNIRYQQNLAGRLLSILEITVNNWPSIEPHSGTIAKAVDRATPGSYETVQCTDVYRRRTRGGGDSSI